MTYSEITGSSSAELRQKFLDLHVTPIAKAGFAADPALQSFVVAVGQYWCDEAEDAVHTELLPSTIRDPRWPEDCQEPRYFAPDSQYPEFLDAVWGSDWNLPPVPYLDSNGHAITAFAAYCIEGADQEMPVHESSVPYAIVRRGHTAPEIEIEIVGKLRRPEWEDRFDVGFAAEMMEELGAPASRPTTRPVAPARVGWLQRLRRWLGRT